MFSQRRNEGKKRKILLFIENCTVPRSELNSFHHTPRENYYFSIEA